MKNNHLSASTPNQKELDLGRLKTFALKALFSITALPRATNCHEPDVLENTRKVTGCKAKRRAIPKYLKPTIIINNQKNHLL